MYEVTSAVMAYGKNGFGFKCILGITSMDNERSIRLLEKLGIKEEETVQSPSDDEELSCISLMWIKWKYNLHKTIL